MLYFYYGTDRGKARAEMNKTLAVAKKKHVIRVTDANSVADLEEALRGAGMFGEKRVVVFDGVCANEGMKDALVRALPQIGKSEEVFFVLEEKPDAEMRRALERYAKTVERFEIKKEKRGSEIFALAYALKVGDRKRLWVEYQRALLRDDAPEAIHGVLFWGAKDMLLRAKARSSEQRRGEKLVAELAELPHEARRRGFELEYALEHYILGFSRRAR